MGKMTQFLSLTYGWLSNPFNCSESIDYISHISQKKQANNFQSHFASPQGVSVRYSIDVQGSITSNQLLFPGENIYGAAVSEQPRHHKWIINIPQYLGKQD